MKLKKIVKISLRKIIYTIFCLIVNIRINKAKYIHFMNNDKFNKPFVDFLNKNFNKEEHLILCKRSFDCFPFPSGKNVIEIKSIKGLFFFNVKKIICHSLFDEEVVNFLYNHKKILQKKSYWMIWGGDLYSAPRDIKNDYIRKNFKGYLTDVDKDVLIKKYNPYNTNIYSVHAIFPITREMIINNLKKIKKNNKEIQIQINNSCDQSTLEVLDILKKFKDKHIKITTVLSYGDLQYKNKIINKGKQIYGNKFEYIDSIMPPEQYAKLLAKNDILILNQNRQQGIGNTIVSLAMGKKVYIRSDISTYSKLREFNIIVYDTNKINDMSFIDFIKNNDYIDSQKNALSFVSSETNYMLWNKVFQSK